MNQPLFKILTAFILGILLAEYVQVSLVLAAVLIPSLLCCSVLLKRPFLQALLLLCVFLSLGAFGETLMMHRVPGDHILWRTVPDEKPLVVGRVISFPETFPDKMRFLLSVQTCGKRKASGIVLLSIYPSSGHHAAGAMPVLDYGDRVEVSGKFRPPRSYRNPGALDYVSFWKRKGVRVIGSASARQVRLLEKGRGNPVVAWIMRVKKDFHVFLDTSLPAREAGMIKAMVTGERGGIARDLQERFSRSGAAHLLAISGLHMGFLSLFCYRFFLIFFRTVLPVSFLNKSFYWTIPSRLAAIMTFVFLPFYVVLAGGRTASVRAAVMIMVFLAARILERQRDLFQTLILAALVLLGWSPASLFEVDFQLSFAAVTAIVLALRQVPETREDPLSCVQGRTTGAVRRFFIGTAGLLRMSILAVAATAPITAATFHRVSLVGIATNLVFVPLTGFLILPCGLAAFLLHTAYAPLAVWPARAAGIGCSLLVKGVDLFGSLHYAAPWVFPPAGLMTALYYLGFLLLLTLPEAGRVRRYAGLLMLCLLFFAGNAWYGRLRPDGLLHIRFLDVGQGASTLMILPGGSTVLIDGGGAFDSSYDVGKRVVLPTLLAQGIRRIDVMVLSHPHPDHLNGLLGVLEEIPVGEVWDAWEAYPSQSYRRFRRLLRARHIRRRSLHRDFNTIRVENVDFEVLHHGSGFTHGSNSRVNNDSLVLRATFGDIGFLMTGDLEVDGEKTLLKGRPARLRSAILQAPHHGSISSSSLAFLDAVRPEVAVFQAGPSNRFHFPSSEVLGRYAYLIPRKNILRTDEKGAVWLRTDGKTIRGCTFESGHAAPFLLRLPDGGMPGP